MLNTNFSKYTRSTIRLLSSITAAFLLMFHCIASADLIDAFQNGGFEGFVGNTNTFNSATPPGWTTTAGTPDVFNQSTTFAGFAWASSSTGGDFLHGIGNDNALGVGYVESALQVGLDGLVIGQEYEISFEQSISNGSFAVTNGYWEVIFGTESHISEIMSIPDLGVTADWVWQTMLFTATNTIQTLEVISRSGTGIRTDIGIDSFFLGDPGTNPDNPDTPDIPDPPEKPDASVPEPSTLALFGLGILGVFGIRKIRL